MADNDEIEKVAARWFEQAKEHWKDVNWLLEGRRYSACLYFCHQTLEKALKGTIVINKKTIPPKIHHLDTLALKSGLETTDELIADLAGITKHFWRVRYPDYRQSVYKSKRKIWPIYKKTEEIYLWLLKKSLEKN